MINTSTAARVLFQALPELQDCDIQIRYSQTWQDSETCDSVIVFSQLTDLYAVEFPGEIHCDNPALAQADIRPVTAEQVLGIMAEFSCR